MTKRPTNQELCAEFRKLLTEGARDAFTTMAHEHGELLTPQNLVDRSKPWRNELWQAFAELEARLCPLEVEARRRERAAGRNEKASDI